jgi:SAM-dependent methyltransferase
MFFSDKVAAYREARRVLRPGGRLVFNVWDRIERSELAYLVSEAVAAAFPSDPPRFLARIPHGYHATDVIRTELLAASFTTVAIDTVQLRSRAPSPRHPALGFCQGTPLRAEILARDPGRLDEVTDAAARTVARQFGDGAIEGLMQAHVITATR